LEALSYTHKDSDHVERKERTMPNVTNESNCPFFGYQAIEKLRVMAASGGNQCALIDSAYAPCRMVIAGQNPNWAQCPMQRVVLPEFAADVASFAKVDLRNGPTLRLEAP
jgi:hypothetical protein